MTQLTETQLKALDWALTCLIEQTAENAHGYQPDQAVDEILDLRSLVDLLPAGELFCRLSAHCEEIRREHQARLDAEAAQNRVGLTTSVNGNDVGHEFSDLEQAASYAADWIRGIKGCVSSDFRIYIEMPTKS